MPGLEFAWRVHAAQEQWVARVDTKATIVVTIEGAVIAAVATAWGNTAFAGAFIGWRLPVSSLGLLSSAVALLAAFLVIIPQLGPRAVSHEAHFVHFGHLRRWEPARLAEEITALSTEEEITQLSVQLTQLGKVNWRKYRLLRIAVVAALLGALLLVVAFGWPR